MDNQVRLLDKLVESIVRGGISVYSDKGQIFLGRKAYSPVTLRMLYIYGYLNGINSSRKLGKEARRNIELIWLLGALKPDFKAIADYRKDNGDKIERVLEQFIRFPRIEGYIEGEMASIDGTKVRANAHRSVKLEGLEGKLQNLAGQLREYLELSDRNDAGDEFGNSQELEQPNAGWGKSL